MSTGRYGALAVMVNIPAHTLRHTHAHTHIHTPCMHIHTPRMHTPCSLVTSWPTQPSQWSVSSQCYPLLESLPSPDPKPQQARTHTHANNNTQAHVHACMHICTHTCTLGLASTHGHTEHLNLLWTTQIRHYQNPSLQCAFEPITITVTHCPTCHIDQVPSNQAERSHALACSRLTW